MDELKPAQQSRFTRRNFLGTTAGVGLAAIILPSPARAGQDLSDRLSVVASKMTVEHSRAPLGIDVTEPRLSWQLESQSKNQSQLAYQVVVASSEQKAQSGRPDIWDSGKVSSDRSLDVVYGGPALKSTTRYHWRMRVWDSRGEASNWSDVAYWETGLLDESDWHAKWIGTPAPPRLDGASWVWYPEGDPTQDAPVATRYFRKAIDIAAGSKVINAQVLLAADDEIDLWVNGEKLATSPRVYESWKQAILVDVTEALREGANVVAIAAGNTSGPAGMIARVRVDIEGVSPIEIVTDSSWTAANTETDGWRETGFDDSSWPKALLLAQYGSGPWGANVAMSSQPPYLRREFSIDKRVARARLDVTALGFYEASLNGKKVTKDLFTPGFTDFAKRVQYQTYDVTNLLHEGRNAIGALLANGWYAGFIPTRGYGVYGDRPYLHAQLRIDYTDGTSSEVVTDSSWKTAPSPLQFSDLYMGETYDASQAKPGWDTADFDDSLWRPVLVDDAIIKTAKLDSIGSPAVRKAGEIQPVKVTQPEPGHFVFDFGQNVAGWIELRVKGPKGTAVIARHAEVLNPDGTLYTAALRLAKATDTFILAGTGDTETFEPKFTYHGFRYLELTGFPGEPTRDSVTAVYATADLPKAGQLTTSDPLINQLQENIEWTQNNDFWSFPTDCHQRDERLPWVSADIQQFIPTALMNVSAQAYFADWMRSVGESQRADQSFPDTAPDVGLTSGNAGWGDAALIVPFSLWQEYGETRVISDHWEGFKRYMKFLEDRSPGYLAPGITYGDWLNAEDDTPKDIIATAYFAWVSDLMSKMASAIGKHADSALYETLFKNVRTAFNTAYVRPDGTIVSNSQTAYVMALSMNLLPDNLRQAAADHLVTNIKAHDMHLTTGFLGTAKLLPVLTEMGHADIAHALIKQKTYPSWGYQIENGATTVWEHWDSLKPDGTFENPAMNSFNHYGIAGVGEWMYESIGGIMRDPESPGYKHFNIRPVPGSLTHADVSHDSPYGTIVSRWTRSSKAFKLHVEVPVNSTATVFVPAKQEGDVTVAQEGTRFTGMAGEYAKYEVGSGGYGFTSSSSF